jgi:hypothetical protein
MAEELLFLLGFSLALGIFGFAIAQSICKVLIKDEKMRAMALAISAPIWSMLLAMIILLSGISDLLIEILVAI